MNKIYLLFICILTACSSPVDKVTKSKNTAIQKVIAHNDAHEVQILYTQIDSTKEGAFTFKDNNYHLDNSNYFYPGTMVMLPMAVFASEYIATIPEITIDTPYAISNDSLKNSVAN